MSTSVSVSTDRQLDQVFHALADPTRRRLMANLARGEATVTELAAPFDMSLPAVSKHLVVLERAGLLNRRIDGRVHHCSLRPEALANASDWIAFYEQFWKQRLGRLAEWLSAENSDAKEET
jgi:DNA-binding transcriptional ArsR family regulator